jgi:hypothetical protein
MASQGMKFRKMGLIDHVEAISQINFANAFRYITREVLKDSNEPEGYRNQGKERLSQLTRRLYELSQYKK